MKRKLLAALCVTAMSAGLLAGCGSSDKTEESTKTEETAKEETSSQEETETKAASSDSDNVASEEEAEKAYGELREKFGSRTDITLVKGDQPVYYFILSVE